MTETCLDLGNYGRLTPLDKINSEIAQGFMITDVGSR